jgi:hypothetical protein
VKDDKDLEWVGVLLCLASAVLAVGLFVAIALYWV